VTDALKRIEEKHGVGGNPVSLLSNYCAICDTKAPCDVVKLARALDDVLMWADPVKGESFWTSCEEAKRVLREVADG
jgi:hypothetical protein